MALLVGTRDGIYRTDGAPFDDAERVLDCGRAPRIRELDGHEGTFAATESGLYRSADDGRSWDRLDLPDADEVWEVTATAAGRIYAGSQPARLQYSTDGGGSWTEVESLRDATTVDLWRSAYSPDAHVRAIVAPPGTPERVFAGVEVGGLYRSEDGGETWSKCEIRDEAGVVQDDVHDVIPLSADEYVVACGRLSIHDPNHAAAEGGLYRTDDAGATWSRLDRDLGPSYYRAAVVHRGTLYTCGATTVPPEWAGFLDADATMFASDDGGETFDEVGYPGGPDEIVLGFEPDGDRLLAGTAVGESGRVLARDPGKAWETAGFVPEDVFDLHAG